MKFREALYRFCRGRNGSDLLYRVTVWVIMILAVANLFLRSMIVLAIELILLVWSTFRCFSRNLAARAREDRAFRRFFGGIRGWFVLQRDKIRDRKTHVFRKCPHCRRILRLPRIKGDHTVCCPCCKARFPVKVRG